MGYSSTAKASYTLDAIGKLIAAKTSNGMPDGGFYEVGREQADGAITGTVYRTWPALPLRCERRGSFRIEPDGAVKRFPGLPAALLRKAEQMGAATYKANYGTWQERGAAFLAEMESGRVIGKLSWSWFESIFKAWQQEKRIMFAVMPDATNEGMIEALRGMLSA